MTKIKKAFVTLDTLIDEAKKYSERFEELMAQGALIQDKDGNTYKLDPSEEFRQCFDPNDKPRSQLPPYWFLSHSGILISLSYETPCWIRKGYKHKKRMGRAYCHVSTKRFSNVEMKDLSWRALMNLVWDGKRFGRAQEILNEKGIFAFTIGYKPGYVNCHHLNGIHDDSPENTLIVTSEAHVVLNRIPKANASAEDIAKWCSETLNPMAKKEVPGKVLVTYTGMRSDKDRKLHEDVEKTFEVIDLSSFLNEGLGGGRTFEVIGATVKFIYKEDDISEMSQTSVIK